MAEGRARAARQDRREPPRLRADRGVANGIDAAMHAMEPSVEEAPVDRAPPHAEVAQLPARHHAPLAGGQLSQGPIRGRAAKSHHCDGQCSTPNEPPACARYGGPHERNKSAQTLTPRYPAPRMARLSQVFAGKDREFFDLFEEAADNIVRAADLLDQMLADYPDKVDLARDILICEQEGDRITHDVIQRLNNDVRDADRPRGHARARRDARRRRRLHRRGRRLPRPLQDRGADGAGPAPGARPAAGRAPDRRGDAAAARRSATSPTTPSRSTGSRTRATASSARRIASLFESGIDPLVVIRWKDIFERLEEAIDACEHVANILESIVIKNA